MEKQQEKTDEIEVLKNFLNAILANEVEMPEEFSKLINEHFWELVD